MQLSKFSKQTSVNRGKMSGEKNQLEIECVLGLTCSSPFSLLTLDEREIIYSAGATAVKYDFIKDCQISHIIAANAPKPISCLSKSTDSSLLVIGESGHQPRILVYDIIKDEMIAKLTGHKYGVLTAQLSPDMTFLVSVGYHHDGFIYLWDWKTQKRLCGVKIAAPLFSLAFDPESNYFVTCGVKHMKFWNLKDIKEKLTRNKLEVNDASVMTNYSMEARAGLLGEHKDATLVDVCCIQSMTAETSEVYTYAMTLDGYLLMFNSKGMLEKWLNAKMERGSCIRATHQYLICGGSEGKVRLFEPITLKHLGNIPAPEPLIDQESDEISGFQKIYPQIVCIQPVNNFQIAIVYSNMTLVIFDVQNLKNICQKRKIKNHSDCVWGVQPISISEEKDGFITYSSDGSVRFWDSSVLNQKNISQHNNPTHVTSLLADPNGAKKFQFLDRFGLSNDIKSVTERTGIRSFAIDPERKIIACGDRNGSIGIFWFENLKKIATINAHDAEIMVLDFAVLGGDKMLSLCSASRDRLIHIFDANQRDGIYLFDLLQTLDDHSSTLTSIMFADSGSKLISCGADKAIIFRSLQDDIQLNFATYKNTSLRSTVYDMALAQVSRIIITASQDKRITFLDIDSGKSIRSFIASIQPSDSSIKASPFLNTLTTDPTGSIICAGASDKSVHLIECLTGNSLYQGYGHGDLITNVAFINQGSHIVSTSADGCIFVWKTPETIIKKMGYLPKFNNLSLPLAPSENEELSPGSVFQFDESHLPVWARTEKQDISGADPVKQAAQGRWAERVDRAGVKLFTQDVAVSAVVNPGYAYNRPFLVENEQRKSAEVLKDASISMADLSIHIVDQSNVLYSNDEKIPSERLIQDPFADTIETDSDEILSEVLDLKSEDYSNRIDRASMSSQHFLKIHNLVTNNNDAVQNLPESSRKENGDLNVAKIQMLAENTSTNIMALADKSVIEGLNKLEPILESMAMPENSEKIYNLLDRYSDILVKLVKEKLKKV